MLVILSNFIFSFQPSPTSLGESPQHRHRIAQVFSQMNRFFFALNDTNIQNALTGCFQYVFKLKESFKCALLLSFWKLQSNIELH